MHYGNKLKWLIKNKGLSQRDVAQRLNVPETTLSGWTLNEYPPLDAIESVCSILQIPISRFFAEDSDLYVEVSPDEMQLLKAFWEFPEGRKRDLLRIIDILRGW